MKRTPLERKTELERKPPARPRAPRRKPVDKADVDAAKAWRQAVNGPCAMCRARPATAEEFAAHRPDFRVLEAHHLLPKRMLKAHGHHDALWDPANGMSLCRWHHARHESHRQRVPRAIVPPAAFAFAESLGLGWIMDREYPA